jgi:tetratricopeptide (TPR) repeat protein
MMQVEAKQLMPSGDAFLDAVERHKKGDFKSAERIYRDLISNNPADVVSLNNLAQIVPVDEGKTLLEKAIYLRPDYVDAHVNLARFDQVAGDIDSAIAHLETAVQYDGNKINIHSELGNLYFAQKKIPEAISSLQNAYKLAPTDASVLERLGQIFAFSSIASANQKMLVDQALYWFEKALAVNPTLALPNKFVGEVLEGRGRPERARSYQARVTRPQPLDIVKSDENGRSILVLLAAGLGNLQFNTVISKRHTQLKFQIAFSTEDQIRDLPPYDIVFNCIGNADFLTPDLIGSLKAFEDRTVHKVLNKIERVADTRRDRLPELLKGIPNIVVPDVAHMPMSEFKSFQQDQDLSRYHLRYPFIVRSVGGHGGYAMDLVQDEAALAAVNMGEAEAVYCINFHDYKSPDGYYRKYRTLFIDREIYHYHLAISQQWIVHYFSADMLAEPFKREEEKLYLEQPDTVLGRKAIQALHDIAKTLDLDYAGIDYSVLPDGQLLVFEANPLISVYPVDPEKFPYKTRFIDTIFKAVDTMLCR